MDMLARGCAIASRRPVLNMDSKCLCLGSMVTGSDSSSPVCLDAQLQRSATRLGHHEFVNKEAGAAADLAAAAVAAVTPQL